MTLDELLAVPARPWSRKTIDALQHIARDRRNSVEDRARAIRHLQAVIWECPLPEGMSDRDVIARNIREGRRHVGNDLYRMYRHLLHW
jgi:hypothetical protein